MLLPLSVISCGGLIFTLLVWGFFVVLFGLIFFKDVEFLKRQLDMVER